jgi:hypothetical protein
MELHIPKITLESLSETQVAQFKNLSSQAYGEQLAIKVSEKLINNPAEIHGLFLSHRDYCGLGLFIDKDTFILSTVYDGYGIHTIIASFNSKADFVTWLAHENDQSMSLFGEKFNNQTITKLRLDWFLEAHYSPVWNDYCLYAHTKLK